MSACGGERIHREAFLNGCGRQGNDVAEREILALGERPQLTHAMTDSGDSEAVLPLHGAEAVKILIGAVALEGAAGFVQDQSTEDDRQAVLVMNAAV